MGLDVGAPAGEHESVDTLDEGLDVEPVAQRWQHEGYATGEPLDRIDVLRAGSVYGMAPVLQHHHARRHAYERFGVGMQCGRGLAHGGET